MMAGIVRRPIYGRGQLISMGTRSLLGAAIAFALMAYAASQASAAPPVEGVTCGETITHSLTLGNDMPCGGFPITSGMVIGADNITIDLGGHTVTTSYGTGIVSSGHTGITIQNGSLTATEGAGISLIGDHNDVVNHVTGEAEFAPVGLSGGSGNTVEGSTLSADFGGPALSLNAEQGDTISANSVTHAGTPGGGNAIKLDQSNGNQVTGNVMEGTLVIGGNSNTVSSNQMSNAQSDGLDVAGTGNFIRQNTAFTDGTQGSPAADGIKVTTAGNTLTGNIADLNGNYGIEAVAGNIDGGGNQANGNGNAAQCLNVACTSTPSAPTAPTGLTATPGSGSIALSWQPNPAGQGILHYNVYRTDQNFTGPWATPLGPTFTNTSNVVNGTSYCYQVSATNNTGEGPKTAPVCATASGPSNPVPGVPTGLTATPGNGSVKLSWQPNPGADAVVHYSVYRLDQPFNGAWATVPGTTFTNLSEVVNGTTYCYEITATNASGESAKSAEACATPTGPKPPIPAAPVLIAANAGNGSATLAWTANPGSDDVLYYSVYRVDKLFGGPWKSLTGTNYTDSVDVTNGVTYCYVVTATSAAGESARSAEACVTPTAPKPPPKPAPPPAPTITSGPRATTSSATATFYFTDREGGVQFLCSLGNQPFTSCTSPKKYTNLNSGFNSFQVRARDSLGQLSVTSPTWRWDIVGQVQERGPTKNTITLKNIRQWMVTAVQIRFYHANQNAKPSAFHLSKCSREKSGRFRCDVSWKRAPYVYSGTATIGSLNKKGHFRSGFTLTRRNTLTGKKTRITIKY